MAFIDTGFDTPSRSASDVIEQAIREFLSGSRETMNKLSVDVTANATMLKFDYDVSHIAADSYIEIDTEVYRVWEIDRSSSTAVVEPAMIGSTTAPHTAGALVYVNPRIFRHAALTALNDELGALSSPALGLFAVTQSELVVQGGISEYNFDTGTSEVLDVIEVRTSTPGANQHWPQLEDWKFRRNMDTTKFPAGQTMYLPVAWPGQTVQVIYSTRFLPASSVTDNIQSVCGLPECAQDILVMGTILRLGAVREIKRNFTETQGDTRRATEVPATAVSNSFAQVRAMRHDRIAEEAARLMRKWGLYQR